LKSRLLQIILILLLTVNTAWAGEINHNTNALVAGDYKTGDIVYDYKGDEKLAIASTTKLMTYLVVKDEIASGRGNLKESITIDAEVASTGGSTFMLREGEEVSVELLLEAILIVSGNDACLAIAKHFGGSESGFVEMMNQKAKELGLENSTFYTSNGLPDKSGRENTMTAKELYKLSSHILGKYPEVIEITEKQRLVVESRGYAGSNTNPLLGVVKGIDGLKTGYTDKAGRCLVATGEQQDGNRVIGIVMGAESEQARAEKSKELMNSIMDDYSRVSLYLKEESVGERSVDDSKHRRIELYPVEDVEVFLEKESEVPKQEIVMKEEIEFPIEPGDVVGKLRLNYGIVEKEVDLTVGEKISRFKLFRIGVSNFFKSLI
jgi:serine-type D-Ala-D-Ala carboxypeptidase (penicillin-binding protein 5/6)